LSLLIPLTHAPKQTKNTKQTTKQLDAGISGLYAPKTKPNLKNRPKLTISLINLTRIASGTG